MKKCLYQDLAKRTEAEIVCGSLFIPSPTSHLAWKSDPRARRAAPCQDKIGATRHQWLFAHSLATGRAAHTTLGDC